MTNNYMDKDRLPKEELDKPLPTQAEYQQALAKLKQAIQTVHAFNFDDYRKANLGSNSQNDLDKRYNQAVKELEQAHFDYRSKKIRGGF